MKIIETLDKGKGVICEKKIKKGEFIVEYCGEIFHQTDVAYKERYKKYTPDSTYLFQLIDKFIIDARFKGNIARYINHSCNPNS